MAGSRELDEQWFPCRSVSMSFLVMEGPKWKERPKIGFETMETSHLCEGHNDVQCDCTVVNRSSNFVWSHSPPFNQMGNSRSCGPATQTHCLMAKIENTNIPTWFWVGTRSQYAHEGMKNRGPILVFDRSFVRFCSFREGQRGIGKARVRVTRILPTHAGW